MLDSEKSWLAGALEAMLFVTDEPVTVLTFADMLEQSQQSFRKRLRSFSGHSSMTSVVFNCERWRVVGGCIRILDTTSS